MNRNPGPALEARNVNFSYRKPIVRGLDLALRAGTVTGILGPNGAGKTTVLRLLCGLLKPDSGTIILQGGTPIASLPRRTLARRIAMVPQGAGNGSQLLVPQFAMLGRSPHLSLFGFESARDVEITLAALEMTRMTNLMEARVCELSGGEKQRLLLARALVQEPEILLLDELTANLDINYQIELLGLVRRLTRERNIATLVVSHEIHLLAGFADRIALMSEGAVRLQGEVAEVITREHLRGLFGLDFEVRPLPGGAPGVLPLIDERRYP